MNESKSGVISNLNMIINQLREENQNLNKKMLEAYKQEKETLEKEVEAHYLTKGQLK
jgi:hypothetical protein